MKLDYPNALDLEQARLDGRTDVGGDIFVHGKDVTIGCLAMGDGPIEEPIVLIADVGVAHTRVIVAPSDLRSGRSLHPRCR